MSLVKGSTLYCTDCGGIAGIYGSGSPIAFIGGYPYCGSCYNKKANPRLGPPKTPKPAVKDTNPKDALAGKKAPLSTLPTGPMYEVALAMLEGARKYGRHNYRVKGVKASVYYDAAIGHLTAWWEGEDIDPASGLHHLAKCMAGLAVVRDGMMMKNWIDDRPPRYPDASKLMRSHPAVAGILERYPDCVEPYTEANKRLRRDKV